VQIVHLVFEAPLPTGSGAQLRSHALNAALSRLGTVTTIAVQDWFRSGKAYPRRRPSHVVAEIPAPILDEIGARVAAVAPDFVLVEGVYLADLAQRLITEGHRVVLDAHNVESLLQRQIDIARSGLWARLVRRQRWRRAARAERAILEQVAAIWACSATDAARIADLAPAARPADVVPNPVPAWCTGAMPGPDQDGISALFIGHLGYRPNIHAALRLARRILPQLLRAEPSARLTLAGRAPGRRLRKALAGTAGLRLLADPPDLAPLYGGANMALIPLREGGGTRIKVLEAMACGVPVIASAIAVEGLAVQPGVQFLRAETDADFVAAALRLGHDAALRAALRLAGRAFAQHHHGAAAIDRALATALHKMGTAVER